MYPTRAATIPGGTLIALMPPPKDFCPYWLALEVGRVGRPAGEYNPDEEVDILYLESADKAERYTPSTRYHLVDAKRRTVFRSQILCDVTGRRDQNDRSVVLQAWAGNTGAIGHEEVCQLVAEDRQHSGYEEEEIDPLMVIADDLPPCTEAALTTLFETFGPVDRVARLGLASMAFVTFRTEKGAKASLRKETVSPPPPSNAQPQHPRPRPPPRRRPPPPPSSDTSLLRLRSASDLSSWT